MLVPTVEMVLADVLVTLEIELPVGLLVAGWRGRGQEGAFMMILA